MTNLNKNQKIFIIIFIIIVIALLGYTFFNLYFDNNKDLDYNEDLMVNVTNTNEIQENVNTTIEVSSEKIVVYIIGCVQNPGIYKLNVDSRVSDAVEAAGGLLEDADTSKINLAYKLEDGQKITIPSVKEIQNNNTTYEDYISIDAGEMISQTYNNSRQNNTKKVNINSASQTELETIPGIGPSTALKIISYRSENGKFKSIEDLKNVSGIGEAKFNTMKDSICI